MNSSWQSRGCDDPGFHCNDVMRCADAGESKAAEDTFKGSTALDAAAAATGPSNLRKTPEYKSKTHTKHFLRF